MSLVAILDADKEGFLRSSGSPIQTMGRAARHGEGRAILCADVMTDSRRKAIDETTRRRRTQQEYNERNGITPQSIMKPIDTVPLESDDEIESMTPQQREHLLGELEERMREAARKFEFEKAAQIRDKLKALRANPVECIAATAGSHSRLEQ